MLSSPNIPPGWMIVSVSSPPSAERTTTLTRPEITTIKLGVADLNLVPAGKGGHRT
jgi:hypothetical protein